MDYGIKPGTFGYGAASPPPSGGFDLSSTMTRIFGLSMFASIFAGNSEGVGGTSLKLIVLGMLVELGRRFVQWVVERFRLQYSITAEFSEGDPAYDWIINFITQEKVWRRSRDFRVAAKSSQRRWAISTANESQVINSAEYVPTYDFPQLFWWRRYWIEIKRTKGQVASMSPFGGGGPSGASIYLTIYTLDMTVLSRLVEEAKKRYFEVSRPHVIVHSVTAHSYGPKFYWNNVKQKPRRPLSSIILPGDTLNELIADVKDFLKMEDWYMSAGIPHRRGYLLYGPPGTGKSSTIHAIAGEMRMEIYSVSLAAHFVDDTFLEQAVSSVPKGSILLIEDIDCAFSREEDEDEGPGDFGNPSGMVISNLRRRGRRSAVTLSGLLNILDGVGSEEGKIFFATTNHIDSLDPALLRPGRIDRKVEYKLATHAQAAALFDRFYPIEHVTPESLAGSSTVTGEKKISVLKNLNDEFTANVPQHEFSTAELQGYLLSCKMMPEKAAKGVQGWIADERRQREEKQARIEAKKRKQMDRQEKMEVQKFQSTLARIGGVGLGHANIAGAGSVEKKPSEIPPPPTVGKQVNGTKVIATNGNDSDNTRVNGDAPSEGTNDV